VTGITIFYPQTNNTGTCNVTSYHP